MDYSEQVEKDYKLFMNAITSGRIKATGDADATSAARCKRGLIQKSVDGFPYQGYGGEA